MHTFLLLLCVTFCAYFLGVLIVFWKEQPKKSILVKQDLKFQGYDKFFGKANPKYDKNISGRVISHGTVFNYFARFSSLLKSVPIAVTYPEIFSGDQFQQVV